MNEISDSAILAALRRQMATAVAKLTRASGDSPSARASQTAHGRPTKTVGLEQDLEKGHEIARALNVSEAEYDKRLEQLRSAALATIRQTGIDLDGQSLLDVGIDQSEARKRGGTNRACRSCGRRPLPVSARC